MNYSNAALYAFLFKERMQMTNGQCWKRFSGQDALVLAAREHSEQLEALTDEFLFGSPAPGADGMICPFDAEFPVLNSCCSLADRPFLLFYRGDLSLLADLNRNVAVIGSVEPDDEILLREQNIIKYLVEKGMVIVSGLAKGCDAAAHQACLAAGGKTVAILPSHLEKIYPAQNRELAEQIVQSGGLLLTEYAAAPANRFASVKRFTDRDRLQAMFSKGVILAASARKGEGDSGSRYAMEAAKKYQIGRYVMFDPKKDSGKLLFGLNQDLLGKEEDVKSLRPSLLEELVSKKNPVLFRENEIEQTRLDIG